MKEHRLFRSHGKRQWTIGMYSSFKLAREAAVAHVVEKGHVYLPGTTLHIECVKFVGVIVGNTLGKKPRSNWSTPT